MGSSLKGILRLLCLRKRYKFRSKKIMSNAVMEGGMISHQPKKFPPFEAKKAPKTGAFGIQLCL
jgi:hypothetical protein